jgi:predicted membrane-bound spermidine synthase
MVPITTLFLIIFLEGYVVLSTELLAIRLLIPFTGSGTDTVSIIIAAVLLPLAFGYFAGGRFKTRRGNGRRSMTVRRRLILNLVIAASILTLGLSYIFLDWAFTAVQKGTGWHNRIWLTTLYSLLFVVYPVFLLGQTVPLISNYFSRERLSLIAGRILFFSTMGSFMGAVFGTLVLMTMLGVHHTVSITIACMTLLVFMLSKKKISLPTIATTACLLVALALNSKQAMDRMFIVSNNKYNVVQLMQYVDKDIRVMKLNRSHASAIRINSDAPYLDYAIFIEDNFLQPIAEGPEKSILVLGAGGFTLGRTDIKNRYVFVDIDKDLKEISEKLFLQEKLPPNKSFEAMDARAYLNQSDEKFDIIILDLFRDPISTPENLITREFFEQAKSHLKDGGIMIGNYFASPTFADSYSRNLDYTLRSVFPTLNRQIVKSFDAWKRDDDWTNIVYSYVHHPDENPVIYTDDKNTALFDKPVTLHH